MKIFWEKSSSPEKIPTFLEAELHSGIFAAKKTTGKIIKDPKEDDGLRFPGGAEANLRKRF